MNMINNRTWRAVSSSCDLVCHL